MLLYYLLGVLSSGDLFIAINKSIENVHIPISGTQPSHGGNETFPGWGQNIPKLGKYYALLMAMCTTLVCTFCYVFAENSSISQQISQNPHKHWCFER